jgi:hypothetical protein
MCHHDGRQLVRREYVSLGLTRLEGRVLDHEVRVRHVLVIAQEVAVSAHDALCPQSVTQSGESLYAARIHVVGDHRRVRRAAVDRPH